MLVGTSPGDSLQLARLNSEWHKRFSQDTGSSRIKSIRSSHPLPPTGKNMFLCVHHVGRLGDDLPAITVSSVLDHSGCIRVQCSRGQRKTLKIRLSSVVNKKVRLPAEELKACLWLKDCRSLKSFSVPTEWFVLSAYCALLPLHDGFNRLLMRMRGRRNDFEDTPVVHHDSELTGMEMSVIGAAKNSHQQLPQQSYINFFPLKSMHAVEAALGRPKSIPRGLCSAYANALIPFCLSPSDER